jgi:hypothetical protein
MALHSYPHAWIEEKQFQKKALSSSRFSFFVLTKNLAKQFVLIAQGILKLDDSQRKTLGGYIVTYIGVRVRDVSWRLTHEAKSGEVAWLTLDLLILLWAGGIVIGEVKVAEGSTRLGHHLLKLLLLLIPEVILLFVIALTVVVLLCVVILVEGGVELLPLGAVGDEVGGVTALKAAPRWSPPLLAELMQLSHQQGDLVVGDALVLLIRSFGQRG